MSASSAARSLAPASRSLAPQPPSGRTSLRPDRQMTKANFQPRLYDDDDPLFLTLTGAISVIASAFVCWLSITPRPEDAELITPEVINDLLPMAIILDAPPAPPTVAPPTSTPPAPPRHELAHPPVASNPPADLTPADPDAQPGDAQARRTRELREHSQLIQSLTSEGLSAHLEHALDTSALDDAMQHVGPGDEQASAAPLGPRHGERRDLDAHLDLSPVARHDADSGEQVKVKVRVQPVPTALTLDGADPATIKAVVARQQGTFVSCDENALKREPGLSGRISLGWTITNGKVGEVQVVENSTKSEELAQCFALVVRGMRFGTGVNAEVGAYTWSVSGS